MSERIKVEIRFVGPAALHNLLCWICEEQPAVYDMHPNWCFRPCWGCQEAINPKRNRRHWWNRPSNAAIHGTAG